MRRMDARAAFVVILLIGASCRRNPPATPAKPPFPEPAGKATLADVGLSPITGGYRVCSPRGLHACRARAVTDLGAITFLVTDIGPSPSCQDQEARAVQHCADAGKPYDALKLKCLASQGILNNLFHDSASGGLAPHADERRRLTVRCAEGEAWIDLFTPI